MFVLPPLLRKYGHQPQGKESIIKRLLLSLFLSLLCAVIVPVCLVPLAGAVLRADESRAVGDYWQYSGDADYYRMPLEPPYELVMVDTIDYASLQVWHTNSDILVKGITHYEKQGHIMFGEISKERFASQRTPQDKAWFILDLDTGAKQLFENRDEFILALQGQGMTSINLKTVQQNWDDYWKNPRK